MIHHGDLFTVLPTLADESIDACVTDPPYGIGFMGKEWDTFKPGTGATRKLMHPRERARAKIESANPNINGRHRSPALSPSQIDYDYTAAGLRGFQDWTEQWAREVFRVLKPGAYIVVCCAPRSYHRMACGLEDAGFVIRDKFAWLFSSGFPKSLNFGCKCGGKSVSYSHASAESAPECDVRRVLDADVSPAVNADGEQGQILLDGLSQQGSPERGAARSEPEPRRGEQPVVEGRELHRAGQGLSDDQDAGSSEGTSERLRPGAHRGGGTDAGPPAEAERGSASSGSRSSEQRSRKSASVRLPSRTLDDGARDRGARCERCGGLTAAAGLGTALKPAHEPIALAWKPFKGTIANNWIKHGTGALNIDDGRIVLTNEEPPSGGGSRDSWREMEGRSDRQPHNGGNTTPDLGRWPANVVIDDVAAEAIDAQTGQLKSGAWDGHRNEPKTRGIYQGFPNVQDEAGRPGDIGGASRFYYCAKPSREERDMGCYDIEPKQRDDSRKEGNPGGDNPRNRGLQPRGNYHPTVKPVELMRWLVRLVTPPNGVVLDPFLGSGTTGMACVYEQRQFVGIEREAEYIEIAKRRIAAVAPLFTEAV